MNKMMHKADNLRKIERLIGSVNPQTPQQKDDIERLSKYISNLKLILTCLLDSIHDFGTGALLLGNQGYISYIITQHLIPQANQITIQSSSGNIQNIKAHIINWINGWNALAQPDGGFVNIQAHTSNNYGSGSIYQLISTATGTDEAENFVAALLKVDSLVLNRYDNNTTRPPDTNQVHNNPIAVVNDHALRTTQVPLFFDSLYLANNKPPGSGNRKFFTVRDNGFGSYIFNNRDTNAHPNNFSKTDTIYAGPGRWDNGENEQYMRNAMNQKRPVLRIMETIPQAPHFILTTNNILNNMSGQNYHFDGGVLGFRYITTRDYQDPNTPDGITFGNTIHYGGSSGANVFRYDTFIPFSTLKKLNKTSIKNVITALINNTASNTISINDLQSEMKHWFRCSQWHDGTPKSGEQVLRYALSQPDPSQTTNALMIIGCLLDTKRSGDFMQSASVNALETAYGNRTGIFATNDRIAGYISAKIHGNYTILSVKGSPFTTVAIWNGYNKTYKANDPARPRSAVRPNELSGTNKNVNPVGGGNKRQKHGSNAGRNIKKKKGGIFITNKGDFFQLANEFHELYAQWKEYKRDPDKLVDNMQKLYTFINEHQEFIANLFKNFFTKKITDFDYRKSATKPDIPIDIDTEGNPFYIQEIEDRSIPNFSEVFNAINNRFGTKDVLLESMALNAFKEFSNFIEELDITHMGNGNESFIDPNGSIYENRIHYIGEVYSPYIYILQLIFEYQDKFTVELFTAIHKNYVGMLPSGNDINAQVNALSLIIEFVSLISSRVNEDREDKAIPTPDADKPYDNIWAQIMQTRFDDNEILTNFINWVNKHVQQSSLHEVIKKYEELDDYYIQKYRENMYNLYELAEMLAMKSNNPPTRLANRDDYFYEAVKQGLKFYYDFQVAGLTFEEYFKHTEVKVPAGIQQMQGIQALEPQPNYNDPLSRVPSNTSSNYSRESTVFADRNDGVQPMRDKMIPPQGFPFPFPVQAGGTTKIKFYSVKIEKLRELNKRLRKNKTKNKSNIEKNNKQINELKNKIKKEKLKEKEKEKKQKLKEKEKKQKEKEKKQKEKEDKVKKEKQKKEKEKEKEKEKKHKEKEDKVKKQKEKKQKEKEKKT